MNAKESYDLLIKQLGENTDIWDTKSPTDEDIGCLYITIREKSFGDPKSYFHLNRWAGDSWAMGVADTSSIMKWSKLTKIEVAEVERKLSEWVEELKTL